MSSGNFKRSMNGVAASKFGIRTRNTAESIGGAVEFFGVLFSGIVDGRISVYFKEVLRQAYKLITGSMLVVLTLVFAFGLISGIQGVYTARTFGAPSVAGAFTAIADLRELAPYAFGYMMAAKIAAGYVAEIGTMKISEEIDALDVMGIDSILFLGSTRLLAVLIVVPAMYAVAIVVAFIASYLSVVVQVADVSPGGYLELFWKFQSPSDLLFSMIKVIAMAIFVVLVGIYFGYTVTGGPVGVGRATARSMMVNLIGVHVIGTLGSQIFWAGNPRLPFGGLGVGSHKLP